MKTRTFAEFLKSIIIGLKKSQLPYAITGALAASYYGTPRTTVDADIIIQAQPRDYDKLLSIVEESGLRADRRRIQARLKAGYTIITLHDRSSGHTADFILHIKGKLERRPGSLLGLKTYYQTPESLVLAKLRMVKATIPRERSLKDREDIQAIIRNTRVDLRMIAHLAKTETTLEVYREIMKNAPRAPRGMGS